MSILDEITARKSRGKEGLCNSANCYINLENHVIKLPNALNEKITETLRLGDDYNNLKKILIEIDNKESLFYASFSDSSDFCASISKAREIAVYGDYCLLKLRINSGDNVYFLSSNVYPSMLMTIQLCQTKFSLKDVFTIPAQFVSKGHHYDNSIIMETLGRYSGGEIEICSQRLKEAIEKINEFDKNIKIGQKDLFIIVYLHELAHAMLDSKCEINIEQYDLYNPKNFKYKISYKGDENGKFDDASLAMEESLANMIMLKYIKEYTKKFPADSDLFEKAKYFVLQQCGIYSFGYYQFCADVDWTKWRDYKINHPESDDHLKGWFDKCFLNGDVNISLDDYLKEIFNNTFE